VDNNDTFESEKHHRLDDATVDVGDGLLDYAVALLNILLSAKHRDQKLDDFIGLMAFTFTSFDIVLFDQRSPDHLFIVKSSGEVSQQLRKQPFPSLDKQEMAVLCDLKFNPDWCENYQPYLGSASAALFVTADVGVRRYVLLMLTDNPLAIDRDVLKKVKYGLDSVKIVMSHFAVAQGGNRHVHIDQQAERLAALGQLAAGVAHEINNPLGFVMSNFNTLSAYVANVKGQLADVDADLERSSLSPSQYVQMTNLLEESAEIIGESLEGLTRIKNIVASLNVYNHSATNHHAMVDVRDVVSSALSMILGEVKERAAIIYHTPEIPFYVEGLTAKLQQVVIHLLLNALQSITHGAGKVSIELSLEEGALNPRCSNVCLLIIDNGKGIPKQDLLHIFDPFFTTKQVGSGAGLGLSVAKEIISEHRGTITIDSAVSIGTTAQIRLPLLAPVAAEHTVNN
jgi:signal transduction histidine kinase